jgi:uncharacterized protein YndB with AHSA1/START domain
MPVRRSGGDVIPADAEVVSRVFEAPRELVFEVWTKVEHFARWFGPHGAEIFSCEIDARPGGVIRFGHRLPDGMTIHLNGTFGEVVPNERLVFTTRVVDEHGHPERHPMFPDWPLGVSLESTITFEDAGDRTRVTVAQRVLPLDAASHPAVKRWTNLAREGWMQVLERLGAHLSLVAPRKEPT